MDITRFEVLDIWINRLENSFSLFQLQEYKLKDNYHSFIFLAYNQDLIDILFIFTSIPFQFQCNKLLIKQAAGEVLIDIILVQTTNFKIQKKYSEIILNSIKKT